MKKLNQLLALASVAVALGLSNGQLAAQDQPQQQRPGRGNFDPEQMRQRMMERVREQLEVKSDDEWKVMRLHPQLAHDMLSPIAYLRPALDVPYCHHEKWDGTGYPRGLKGEQIPLAARLFAIVDVWDALRSDRPYRLAWDEAKVRDYLRQQAGTHFDPAIVEAFLVQRQDG